MEHDAQLPCLLAVKERVEFNDYLIHGHDRGTQAYAGTLN
jgi:hypothetical protein